MIHEITKTISKMRSTKHNINENVHASCDGKYDDDDNGDDYDIDS